MQWLWNKVSNSDGSNMISELFFELVFLGTLAANFEFASLALFPFSRLAIAVFLYIYPSIRIDGYFLDCIIIVGSIKVWFLKPPQKPPKTLRNLISNCVRFLFDC